MNKMTISDNARQAAEKIAGSHRSDKWRGPWAGREKC